MLDDLYLFILLPFYHPGHAAWREDNVLFTDQSVPAI
jgi:hypothetical protein